MIKKDGGTEAAGSRQFTVVLRGPSAAVFDEGGGIIFNALNPAVGLIRLHFRTRWLTPADGVKVSGHIWLEATGQAATIDQAIEQFSRAALTFLPVISLATNATIDDCEIELAFDCTPSVSGRDFFQNHLPAERGEARPGRRIDQEATVKLLEAIQHSPHQERVMRAANQYRLALQSWRLGYESMTVAHLWMAAEALTPAFVRTELRRCGLSTYEELAAQIGVEPRQVEATIRREIVFRGDVDCYRDGKAASDGLEHGFLGFDEIRNKSASIRSRMATLIRNAIFDLIELAPEVTQILQTEPFDRPLGNGPMARYLRGKLIGNGEQLAADGGVYPFIEWTVSVKSAAPTGPGRMETSFTESMTPKLGPGIVFKPVKHEVWGND